jgi:hypothetical protein
MARSVGSVEIDIRGDNSHFKAELKEGERITKQTNGVIRGEFRKTATAADKVGRSIKSISTSMIALAAASGLGMAASIGVLKDFGQAMSTVQAVSGATEAQFAALSAEARRLGATTRFSATQAAEGMIYLSRAGFSADEALMSIEGTLQLAQAGALDLGRAADIASNVLGGFNLTAAETPRVVDVLAKAANAANVTVEGLGEGLKYAAPAAAALGLTLEETVATLGKLGDSGIAGGIGGRGFSSFATTFVAKKSEITDIIGAFDLAEEGLTAVTRRLVEAGVSADDVIKIFRAENLDIFNVLGSASLDAAKGTDKLNKSLVDAAGTAKNVSNIMDNNLNGAILATQSALSEVVLAFGDLFVNDTLTAAFSGLASLLRVAAENADILAVAAVGLAIRGLIPLAAAAIPAVTSALRTLQLQLVLTEGAAAKAGLLLGSIGGPITIAIVAAAAAYVYLARSSITASEALTELNDTLGKFDKLQLEITDDTRILERAQRDLTAAIESQGTAAIDAANLEIDAISSRIAKNKELASVYESLARSQLAQVNAAIEIERAKVADKFNQQTGGLAGVQTGAALEQQIDGFRKFVKRQQDAGVALSKFDRNLLASLAQLGQYEIQADAASESVQNLTDVLNGKVVPLKEKEKPKTILGKGTGPTDDEKAAAKVLADQKKILETIREQNALENAKLSGNSELVRQLEKQLDLKARIADYEEGGLVTAKATALAVKDIENAESSRLIGVGIKKRNEQSAANDEKIKLDQEEKDKIKQDFRDTFTDAVTEAITSGNVGEAIRGVFADRVTEGMRDALDNLADAIFDLFAQAFKNSSGGGASGGGGILGGLLNFGVSALTGGLFKGVGTAAAGLSGTAHTGSQSLGGAINAATNIVIQGDASASTIHLMEQKLAEHRRALPGAIDSRLNDRISRGAI